MIYCPKCGEATGWLGPSDLKRDIARLAAERDEKTAKLAKAYRAIGRLTTERDEARLVAHNACEHIESVTYEDHARLMGEISLQRDEARTLCRTLIMPWANPHAIAAKYPWLEAS